MSKHTDYLKKNYFHFEAWIPIKEKETYQEFKALLNAQGRTISGWVRLKMHETIKNELIYKE